MMDRTAYFILNGSGVYEHGLVAIAEGLRTHGYVTVGDRSYWQRSPDPDDFLIRYDPDVGPEEGDFLLVSSASVDAATGRLADDVRAAIRRTRGRTVFLDESDRSITVYRADSAEFDLVLKCHAVAGFRYASNVQP